MTWEIEVVDVPERLTAAVAVSTTWPELPKEAGAAFDDVWALLRSTEGEGLRTDGHNAILYKDGQPNAEVGVLVTRAFEPSGRVVPSILPAGRVVRTIHRGDYDGLAGAHEAVRAWCDDNDTPVTGVRYEIYGDWFDDVSKLETEVAWFV
jgi:effector-binding domain-containing protein